MNRAIRWMYPLLMVINAFGFYVLVFAWMHGDGKPLKDIPAAMMLLAYTVALTKTWRKARYKLPQASNAETT